MLHLFLTLLLAATAVSQPLQENCEDSKYSFLDCAKAAFAEREITNPSFEAAEVVFTQCGARKSECDFQKRLIEFLDTYTAAVKIQQEVQSDEEFRKCSECLIQFYQSCNAESMDIIYQSLNTAMNPITDQMIETNKCMVIHAYESDICTEQAADTYYKWSESISDATDSNAVLGRILMYITALYKKEQVTSN